MKIESMTGREVITIKEEPKIEHTLEKRLFQLETGIDAIFANLSNWPGTMTRERLLQDLYSLKQGYYMETLT